MPNINGLAEAALFVQNISRARDFYEHVVGLEKLQDSEAGCVFAVAKEQLLLLVSPEKAKVPSTTPGGDVPACVVRPGEILGAGHVAFAVAENEIDGWRTRLKSKGVEVLSEVTWERGARSLYFRDPDGHLLEIATPGVWGFDSCSGAVPTLRVARPTDRFDEVVRFYTEGVGLTQLGAFEDHDGFDGVMLGMPAAPYHLEFTRKRGYFAGRAPTEENLLVFYLPDRVQWQAAVDRMTAAGYQPVASFNPYWDRVGRTFQDPDGYRVVLQNAAWSR